MHNHRYRKESQNISTFERRFKDLFLFVELIDLGLQLSDVPVQLLRGVLKALGVC